MLLELKCGLNRVLAYELSCTNKISAPKGLENIYNDLGKSSQISLGTGFQILQYSIIIAGLIFL